MSKKKYEIDKQWCTQLVINAFDDTWEAAKRLRYEFITPEHLLAAITTQNEFISFAKKYSIDLDGMQKELNIYISQLDTIPEGQDYLELMSVTMCQLIEGINRWMDKIKDKPDRMPLTMPQLVMRLSRLDNTIAQYVLRKYLGEDDKAFAQQIDEFYHDDAMQFLMKEISEGNAVVGFPEVHAEAFVNGKKVENLSQEELLSKMMASAGRLMGALHGIKQIHISQIGIGEGENEETISDDNNNEESQHEAWEQLVTCISDTYQQHNPLIGREEEIARAIRVLCRKDKNNPLFIGESGVGKTALIYGLAKMLAEAPFNDINNVPKMLQGMKIYALDMANIVAGTSFHGEFERRMKAVLEGAQHRGNCIIYIDEIHAIMNDSGGNTTSAVDLLKPYLEDGTVRFIGCTTYQDFNRKMANNKAITRRFHQIDIKEPSVADTQLIINGLLPLYEHHHHVRYEEDAVLYAIEQSHRLIQNRFLPDKAIDIIDEAGAYLQQNPLLNKEGKPKAPRFQKVNKDIVKKILIDVCRIDAKALTDDSNDNLKNLANNIGNEIYGQDEAIQKVVRSVMMSKAGLLEPDKPIASLLFVGPTGVGKTEVCRVLARELGIELVRFDMSEYTEKHTISKLIGSPAGYVGYDEGGLLTDAIRKTPNCVLLLDEIEKAHSDIYNLLLQVMDYARLTDNKGNKVDFRRVILVMTSNAGAQFAAQSTIGFAGNQPKGQAMMTAVKKTFKPEFLNRLSGTVVFNDMDEHMASLILDKKLHQLSTRLSSKAVTMKLTPKAHSFLLHRGFSAQYGAREMDRVINQLLTPILMDAILFGKLRKGGDVTIDMKDELLMIK